MAMSQFWGITIHGLKIVKEGEEDPFEGKDDGNDEEDALPELPRMHIAGHNMAAV